MPGPEPRPDRPITYFNRIEGFGGRIEVPHVGIHVGSISHWRLTRRGDDGRDADLFDLHASLSFVNRAIWEDESYEKVVIVKRPRGEFIVERQDPEMRVSVNVKMLIMEGVRFWPQP